MGTRTRRVVTRAMKSMVVVTDREYGDYCSGFVVVDSRSADERGALQTLVVAPTAFVKGKKNLRVLFSDGVQSAASVAAKEKFFSLLTTTYNSNCEAVRLLEDFNSSSFLPRPTFVLPPICSTMIQYVPTYATLESLESFLIEGGSRLESSKDYFLMTCDGYNQITHAGLSRLTATPVFINEGTRLAGLTMGFVLQVTHVIYGSFMKVAVTSTYFKKILNKLDPPPPPRKPRLVDPPRKRWKYGQKQGSFGQKRKRYN